MIKALLIDDEAKALKILENKIQKYFPSIDIVYKTQSPKESIGKILELKPDLVFLDVDMPQLNGFDVLSAIEKPDFEIVFVTAYNDYAIEAIKHCAIGYIVKPIDSNDLKIAIQNAIKNIEKKASLINNTSLLNHITKKSNSIAIPTQKGIRFFKAEKIIRLEGVDGYTKIISVDESILSSYNIGKFKNMLADFNFFQVHKSHLINKDYVQLYLNDGSIELTNGDNVPISKTRRKEFLESI